MRERTTKSTKPGHKNKNFFLSLLFPFVLLVVLSLPQRSAGPTAAIRLNNLGVGYMIPLGQTLGDILDDWRSRVTAA